MTTPADEGIFDLKPQSDYLGGFVGTGIMAIVQTAFPLLVFQLWKKSELENELLNMWYCYAWCAMQATGVVSYGLPALAFIASWMFDLNVMERLGYIMLWVTHGGILALLGAMTTGIYMIVAMSKYEMSAYTSIDEIGIVFAVYTVIQIGFAILAKFTMWDTVMYMISGELKEICEKYGELCSQYGILEKKDGADASSTGDMSNLAAWTW